MLLAACASAAPTVAPPTAPAVTTAFTTAAVLPAEASIADSPIRVGLVTNTGGVNDDAFNQLAWEGVQQASAELGFQATFIDSTQPADYEANIDALVTEGYNVIITVGSSMGDVTALKAKQYPDIKIAIIDHAYIPANGSQSCNDTVIDCYGDGGLTNVTSLMFAEEQAGFLAGVLAGGMSRSGFVCSVTSVPPPASDRYVISFRAGAVWQGGEDIQGMNNYINIQTSNPDIPTITDSTEGHETAQRLIDAGCDVIFGIMANGALRAAHDNNLMAIGADVDQYATYPEVQDALISSAQKNVDVAVYNYLQTVADGTVTAGISTGTLQNGGVGLAPFHNWDSQIPADLKAQLQTAIDGIIAGSLTIDLP
jgi:basic membrane protein A